MGNCEQLRTEILIYPFNNQTLLKLSQETLIQYSGSAHAFAQLTPLIQPLNW